MSKNVFDQTQIDKINLQFKCHSFGGFLLCLQMTLKTGRCFFKLELIKELTAYFFFGNLNKTCNNNICKPNCLLDSASQLF